MTPEASWLTIIVVVSAAWCYLKLGEGGSKLDACTDAREEGKFKGK